MKKFYIARNTIAVTLPGPKKKVLAIWEKHKDEAIREDQATGRQAVYQLCLEEGKLNPTIVMELN